MRYFTKQLWKDINSSDEQTRLQAEKTWDQNDRDYSAVFSAVRHLFPSNFVNTFLEAGGFHDWQICGIHVESMVGEHRCRLELQTDEKAVTLSFEGLQRMALDIPKLDAGMEDTLSWGYCELAAEQDGLLSVNVLCDEESELLFICKSVVVK